LHHTHKICPAVLDQCAVGIHTMCGMHNVSSYFSLTHSTCCTCALLQDILSQWPVHKLYYGQQGRNQPCLEKGCLFRRHEVPPYRGCTVAKKPHEALEKKFLGRHFQSSVRDFTATSCFAWHWHCFLLLHTIQHWLFF